MDTQPPLFAWEHFTQEDVQDVLGPYHPQLWQAIMTPWRDLQRRRHEDPAFRRLPTEGVAQWLHYQIVAEVQSLFPAHEDAPEEVATWFVDDSRMFHLDIAFTQLTFKKLDDDFRRSNYPTSGNLAYWTHALLPGWPKTLNLIVGYQWEDQLATDIRRVVVVCPGRRSPRWWYEIPEPVEAAVPVRASPPGPAAPPEEPEMGFKIKAKSRDRSNTGQAGS